MSLLCGFDKVTIDHYLHCDFFFFSSRRRHTRFDCDWSSDVCSSDLCGRAILMAQLTPEQFADGVSQALGRRLVSLLLYGSAASGTHVPGRSDVNTRSEERRVGKECRSRWSPYH